MLDRVWSIWQELVPARYEDVGGIGIGGAIQTMDSLLPFYNEPIRQSISMRSPGNCYLYDNYSEPYFSPGRKSIVEAAKGNSTEYVGGTASGGTAVFRNTFVPIPNLVPTNDSKMFNFDSVVVERMNNLVKDIIGRMGP
ncbi:hypothetical protein AYI69_g8492 [Smittium culicis]|uniref:Uncharacterized protein n=1 Tax=Smittium culicis TaxID=133412 RepID=A0A1R1XJ75_9FUNG|nr:hypothetical protein AYI69_g8492 [Smittium culicis]